MYSYGYLKDAILAKMDLSSSDANEMGLLSKIPFYCNEALSQITDLKPNRKYVNFSVMNRAFHMEEIRKKYSLNTVNFLENPRITDSMLSPSWIAARKEYLSVSHTGVPVAMPSDFLVWIDDPVYRTDAEFIPYEQVNTTWYHPLGNNQIVFDYPGLYKVPYGAVWFTFMPTTEDRTELDVPIDILDCIPSYVASQLFKIDDEQKSSIYRNEFEMTIARLDDNMYGENLRMKDGRDW